MDKSVPTLADILGDMLRRRDEAFKEYPFGGEVEDDGFVTVYSSVPIIH
jgi:hypothetical protein